MGEIPQRFDLQIALMSIPRILGSTIDNIPAPIPYLSVDPDVREKWRRKMGEKRKPRIGLAWAGNRKHVNDHNRSIDPEALRPLWEMQNAEFYSLQKDNSERRTDLGAPLIDLCGDLQDFADAAALISELDLVISVDTSIVHLAGALGMPVWTLIPFTPDWRWMLSRADSPWYPSMRLFRQPRLGDWAAVIKEVSEQLRSHISEIHHSDTETRS
jgi:hypothetical protein